MGKEHQEPEGLFFVPQKAMPSVVFQTFLNRISRFYLNELHEHQTNARSKRIIDSVEMTLNISRKDE